MNTFKQDYEERKSKVLDYLSQTMQFLDTQEGMKDNVEALKIYQRNIENGLFSIVLVGEFSAGKSTFLNALMHKRILPSFSSETTATVNFLRHISQAPNHEAGIVYYNDHHQEVLPELTLQAVERVVSTRGDTATEKVATSVDHVDLFLDAALLQDGVMLVDSPGLNGVADHHREITERQIRSSHASIFMFSARQPGSKTDFEYLRDLKKQSKNIFLVLNMIDVINPEQETVESVMKNLRSNYSKQFPEETDLPEIWPVSAEAALVARDPSIKTYKNLQSITSQEQRNKLESDSRMEAFEQRLWQYLTQGERSRDQLLEPLDRCLILLKSQKEYFQKRYTLLSESHPDEALLKQRNKLEEEIQTLKKKNQSISSTLRRDVRNALQEVSERGKARCVQITKKIEVEINGIDDIEQLSDYAQGLSNKLRNRYQQIGSEMQIALKDRLLDIVSESYAEWSDEFESKMQEYGGDKIPFTMEPLTLTDTSIAYNLKQFEEICDLKEKELKELEEKAELLEADSLEAKINAKRYAEAQAEIKSLSERIISLQDSFQIPDTVYHTRPTYSQEWRGGLAGIVTTFVFGKKEVTRLETIEDNTARQCALQQRQQQEDLLNEEKSARQVELDSIPKSYQNSTRLEQQAKQARARHEKAAEKLAEMRSEMISKLEEGVKKEARRMRWQILEYAETVQEEYSVALCDELKQLRSSCLKDVQALLNENIIQRLKEAEKQQEELITLLKTQDSEREQKRNIAIEQEEKAIALLKQGAGLYEELKHNMNDQISQEAL